jgi:hypothetical protein
MTPESAIDVEAFKKFECEGFSRVADGYEQTTAIVTSQVNDAILDAVEAGPAMSLLDVACGPGWLTAAAIKRGPSSPPWTLPRRWWPSRASDVLSGRSEWRRRELAVSRKLLQRCCLQPRYPASSRSRDGRRRGPPCAQDGWPLRVYLLDPTNAQSLFEPRSRVGAEAREHECEPTCRAAVVSLWRSLRVRNGLARRRLQISISNGIADGVAVRLARRHCASGYRKHRAAWTNSGDADPGAAWNYRGRHRRGGQEVRDPRGVEIPTAVLLAVGHKA